MDLNNFYLFDLEYSLSYVGILNKELDFNAFCKILKGDLTGIKLPITFIQTSGRKWMDILNPSSVSLYIVVDKFIELMCRNHTTGWKTYPVRILDKKGTEINGYCGLSITGKCGPVDYSKSQIIKKRLVPNGLQTKYYKGLYFDLNNWDGSDIFIPQGSLHIIITEKVKKVIQQNKITNVSLQNLAEYEIAESALPKK